MLPDTFNGSTQDPELGVLGDFKAGPFCLANPGQPGHMEKDPVSETNIRVV